jgi:hypothetical protein
LTILCKKVGRQNIEINRRDNDDDPGINAASQRGKFVSCLVLSVNSTAVQH